TVRFGGIETGCVIHGGIGVVRAQLRQIGKAIMIGVLIAVANPGVACVGAQRVQAQLELLEVGQAIPIGVRIGVHAGVAEILQLPPIGKPVAIAVEGNDLQAVEVGIAVRVWLNINADGLGVRDGHVAKYDGLLAF